MCGNRRRHLTSDEGGISVVIGAILVIAILTVSMVTYQTEYVPIHQKARESEHSSRIASQLAELRSGLDREATAPSGLPVAVPLRLSAGSASFGLNRPSDTLSFRPDSLSSSLTSPSMTIRSDTSGASAGAAEQWQTIGSGTTVTDITKIHNLRLNLSAVNKEQAGKSILVRLTDANGFAGDFEVRIDNPPGNDFGVNYRVRNRLSEILYNQPDQYQQGAGFGFSPFWVNLLEQRFRFDTVIAAAVAPLTVTLIPGTNPLTGSYTISFTQHSTTTILGGPGTTFTPYASPTFSGGNLVYNSNNLYYPRQTFTLENGGVILQQEDGAVFSIPPRIEAARITGVQSALTLNRPSATAANDVLLAQLAWSGGAGIVVTPPAGWTHVQTVSFGTSIAQSIYWKRATSSEPGSYAWGLSSAVKATGSILSYSGLVATGNPIDSISSNMGSGSAITAPSITPTQANTFVLGFFAIASATTITAPSEMSPRSAASTSLPLPISSLATEQFLTTTTATGSRTANAAAGGDNVAQLVGLRAASGIVQRTATSASTSNSGANSLSIAKHSSVVSGDVMFAAIATAQSAVATPPAGWTQLRRDVHSTLALTTFWKTNTGEAGPYVFTLPGGTRAAGGLLAFSGIDTATPTDDSANAQSGTGATVTAPSVSTDRHHEPTIAWFSSLSGSTYSSYTGDMVQAFAQAVGGSNPVSLAAATLVQPALGPSGAKSATASISAANLGQSVSLRAAAHFRSAFSTTTDTGAATRVSISIPHLTGSPYQLTGDKLVTLQTTSAPGTRFQASCYEFSYTFSTAYPKVWSQFLRTQFSNAQLQEGTHFFLDETNPTRLTFRVIGSNTDTTTDDVFLVLQQTDVRLTVRG